MASLTRQESRTGSYDRAKTSFGLGDSVSSEEEEKQMRGIIARHRGTHTFVDESWSPARRKLSVIVMHPAFEILIGAVICIHFAFSVVETNAFAKNQDGWVGVRHISIIFIVIYMTDLMMRAFVMRWDAFKKITDKMDFCIVGFDFILQLSQAFIGDMPPVAALRIFRIARLTRAIRVLTTFNELYIMLHSFVGAMKAMFWGCLMILIVMVVWAIIFVEFVHPLNSKLSEGGSYNDCERCGRAYESVEAAMLTLFQQIIAGDAWGEVTISILEAHPWTVIFYVPAFIMISWGLMNLMLTVVVDKATEARNAHEDEKMALKFELIKVLFEDMDADNSGCVHYSEFMDGLQKFPDFQDALRLVGVRIEDVSNVFDMMDNDNSGSVSYGEFVENLRLMKKEETFTSLLFIKHFFTTLRQQLEGTIKEATAEIKAQPAPPGAMVKLPPDDLASDVDAAGRASTDPEGSLRQHDFGGGVGAAISSCAVPKAHPRDCAHETKVDVQLDLYGLDAIERTLQSFSKRLAEDLSAIASQRHCLEGRASGRLPEEESSVEEVTEDGGRNLAEQLKGSPEAERGRLANEGDGGAQKAAEALLGEETELHGMEADKQVVELPGEIAMLDGTGGSQGPGDRVIDVE